MIQVGYFRTYIQGTSPAVPEVWSVGQAWVGPNTMMPFDDLQEWATNVANAIEVLASNLAIQTLSSAGRITKIRCEQRDEVTEGLILAAEAFLSPPKAGTGTSSHPMQTAIVIGLRSPMPGRSRKGRVYWPAWGSSVDATGRFPTGHPANVATGYKDLLNLFKAQALIVDPAYQMVPGVRSRLLHETTDMTELIVGDVPDTQRRRRDNLAETYVTLPL